MRIIIITIIIIISSVMSVFAINNNVVKTQLFGDSSKPGDYRLVIRNICPNINPGDGIKFEIYVTGYGKISNCKIGMFTSNSVFDENKSEANYGVELIGKELRFGRTSSKIPPSGFGVTIPDIIESSDKRYHASVFGDIAENEMLIGSETKAGNALIEIKLKTSDKIQPGNYECMFYMTYFNGVEWKSENKHIQFTVKNILQRHELLFATLAATAAITAILSFIGKFLLFGRNLIINAKSGNKL